MSATTSATTSDTTFATTSTMSATTSTTPLLQSTTALPHLCYTSATPLLHLCYTSADIEKPPPPPPSSLPQPSSPLPLDNYDNGSGDDNNNQCESILAYNNLSEQSGYFFENSTSAIQPLTMTDVIAPTVGFGNTFDGLQTARPVTYNLLGGRLSALKINLIGLSRN
ncbi:2301_t:CDS:2 [Paraglomus occultum]|uniref:2301_t:CDS:1 n=1 Tax=Paraglomus occultum TaxID=144539 RepID=A0A9N9CG83_9GLOM|nr:2301_t:CDS:2 [Paraglomus occultum]